MDKTKIEEFAKKHTVAIIAIGGGALIAFFIILRGRSSGGSKATLDTLHSDLGQLDFDLNQIDTNLSTGSSWGNNISNPATPASTGNAVTQAELNASTKRIIDLINSKHIATSLAEIDQDVDALQSGRRSSGGAPLPSTSPRGSVGTSQAKNKPLPATKVPGSGKGPEGAYLDDQISDLWNLVGSSDLMAIFDTWHQAEVYSLPGDYNDYANLN